MKIQLLDKIKAAALVDVRKRNLKITPVKKEVKRFKLETVPKKIIAIGASTGGVQSLYDLLTEMPANSPAIAIVQHMPEHFTRSFAKRLNQVCNVEVKEAEDGDLLFPGRVLIAPGNKHMLIKNSPSMGYRVIVKDGPLVCRHRPSVDVLFQSVAQEAGAHAIGVILTGMGKDGSKGMLKMKETGAITIAENEETCVVFGMPKEAIKLNAVDHVLPLQSIAETILNLSY
jgi:two-component system chemotaxis response regulator CheB